MVYQRTLKLIGSFNYSSVGLQNAHPIDKHFNVTASKLKKDRKYGARNVYFTTAEDSLSVKYAVFDRCVMALVSGGTLEYVCNAIEKGMKCPKEGFALEEDVRMVEGDDAPPIGFVLQKDGETRETHRFQIIIKWKDSEYTNRYTQMPFTVVSMMPLNDYEWDD